jgi:hypothetical protein
VRNSPFPFCIEIASISAAASVRAPENWRYQNHFHPENFTKSAVVILSYCEASRPSQRCGLNSQAAHSVFNNEARVTLSWHGRLARVFALCAECFPLKPLKPPLGFPT